MLVVMGEKRNKPRQKQDEVEQIKRLIELQREIVELAKQNELTEKECEALRRELTPAARRVPDTWSVCKFLRNLAQRVKKTAF